MGFYVNNPIFIQYLFTSRACIFNLVTMVPDSRVLTLSLLLDPDMDASIVGWEPRMQYCALAVGVVGRMLQECHSGKYELC